jgi:hypothetical protein
MQAKLDSTTEFINKYFADQWKTQKLTPADRCGDEEFIRRASLDLIGRIATAEEVRAFLADASADKRAKLIDKLMAAPERNHNIAGIWTNRLLGRSGPGLHARGQMYLWFEKQLNSPQYNLKDMAAQVIAGTGKTNDQGNVHFVLSHVGQAFPKEKYSTDGMFDMVPATTGTLRIFLGYRLVAYQLPDHPVHPDFKPDQFWGVNAFFRQVERLGQPGEKPGAVLELKDNTAFNKPGTVTYPDKDGKMQSVAAEFLGGKKLPADGKQSRREVLADFVTSHDNFSKTFVNRLWGHYFGRGLHDRATVDDFGSHHKLVHPELLDRLAKDLVANGYQTKKLVRAICTSDVYQLRSVSNPSNIKEETEVYFSRMPLKIMTPEQLLESVISSLKSEDGLANKLRAGGQEHIARRVADAEWDDLPAQERIIQNVVLINRKDINDAVLTSKTGPVTRALAQKTPEKTLEELYLTALNRRPTEKESNQIKGLLEKEKDKDATALWQDLYWALLNSSEFILNH